MTAPRPEDHALASSAPSAPDVIAARASSDTCLAVTLADGRTGSFDVGPYLAYPAFEALKNPVYFRQVLIAYGTVGWPNGEDLSPETIAARLQADAG